MRSWMTGVERGHHPRVTAMAVLVAFGLLVWPSATNAAVATPQLSLGFDNATLPFGTSQWNSANQGTAAVRFLVSTAGDGRIRSIAGRTSSTDRALRFPTFDPWAPAPQAAMLVTNAGLVDAFDPGTTRFEFGADVTLDALSEDLASTSVDNGNNVLQRGVWADAVQWKLEVDKRRPTCRVKGRSGELNVTAGISLQADRWYRVRCIRDGSKVSTVVTWWSSSGTTTSQTWSKTGLTGDLRPTSSATPIAIGARVANGRIDTGPDQHNGKVDNVVVAIG